MEQFIYAVKQAQEKDIGDPSAILDMVHEWKGMGENLLTSLVERVSDVESREKNLNSVGESLEKRLKDLEEREKKFKSFQEREIRDLALKERALSPIWEDFVKEVKLKEEKLDEQLKSVNEHIASLEVAQSEVEGIRLRECEDLKKIEKRKREIDCIRGSWEKRLKEVEEREKEFNSFQDRRMRELALKEAARGEVEGMRLRECEKVKGIEKREKELDFIRRSLEKRLKEVEEREKEFDSFQDRKRRELALKEAALSEVEVMRLRECEKLKGSEKKEKENDFIGRSLEKRVKEFEEREKEFDSFQDRRMRELALKEDLLSRRREEFAKEVKLANEKFKEGEKLGHAFVERLELALNMLEGMKVTIEDRFKEIESWVTLAHEMLNARINEAELIQESVEKQLREFEKMEREFHSFQNEKMQKLESRERQVSIMRKDLVNEVKLMDAKLIEQQNLGNQLLEFLEAMVAKKLKEIESREVTLNVARETLDATTKDADLVRESANTRFKELEKREEEFRLYQEKKTRELVLEEEKLRLSREKFIQEVKFRKEKLDKQEKLVHGLQERLELAQNDVKDMSMVVTGKLKEIGLKENELNSVRDSIERKRYELELKKKELMEKEKGVKANEDSLIYKENELDVKNKELESKENDFELKEGCLKSQEGCLKSRRKKLDLRKKNLNSVREFIQTSPHEHLALNKPHQPEKDLVENLSEKDQQSECRLRELGSKETQTDYQSKDLEVKHHKLTDGRIEPETKMVRKTLEMFLNNTEKDWELMGDEAFKVLLLSSDPAKLVLDAMVEFYFPHLGEGDMEFKLWRTSILLLDQLSKMSPKIQPCVKKAATKFATEWKSKMRNTAENPMELLAFLHLLAAYNLSSSFNKDGLLSFLKEVAHHKQTPELFRILGFTENIPVLIQNLINEKQYLLASAYIHESELEDMFPQAAVLNYYVKHSKMLAKAKCNRGNSSSEVQDKAIAREIADLRIAMEHIVKYGLESEYSPDTLTAQIKQLERDRAILKNGTGFSSADPQMEDKSGNSQDRQHDTTKKATPDRDAQLPEQAAGEGSSLASETRQPQNKTKKRPPSTPVSIQPNKSCRVTKHVKDEPTSDPCSARERFRPEPPRQIASSSHLVSPPPQRQRLRR
ncbi:hypothetical protein BUALT_Bualt02G0204700 [Buddleja alternifolia]|uniref:FRIGIDA-like protein n=1 Tax=Buddleja alternifolia TaxID=168488 RepID=A0AAV6YCW8_9LAMI|nr:hypothetical protein BUALT_Bualt02G0204700 [Buddleja alternifolia]